MLAYQSIRYQSEQKKKRIYNNNCFVNLDIICAFIFLWMEAKLICVNNINSRTLFCLVFFSYIKDTLNHVQVETFNSIYYSKWSGCTYNNNGAVFQLWNHSKFVKPISHIVEEILTFIKTASYEFTSSSAAMRRKP